MSVITQQWDRIIPNQQWPVVPYYPPPPSLSDEVDVEGFDWPDEKDIISTEELRDILKAFQLAVEAADIADRVTGQEDCVDPVKAQLFERVNKLQETLDIIAFNEALEEKRGVLGDDFVQKHKKTI